MFQAHDTAGRQSYHASVTSCGHAATTLFKVLQMKTSCYLTILANIAATWLPATLPATVPRLETLQ